MMEQGGSQTIWDISLYKFDRLKEVWKRYLIKFFFGIWPAEIERYNELFIQQHPDNLT